MTKPPDDRKGTLPTGAADLTGRVDDDPSITGAATVSLPSGADLKAAVAQMGGYKAVSIVHGGSDDPTLADGGPSIAERGTQPHALGDVTLDDIADDSPTRREGVDTREALDEKIRAHLERDGTKGKQDPLIGQTIGGRFLILKKIGSGGMGSVYRARQEGMDRDVAIKVLLGDLKSNDTVLRRFTLEALAVSRLRHPNTIQIFDYGQTPGGDPYIAMELLEGTTLYDLLHKERLLPIRRALRIMRQVSESLAEAHGKEIVHRDLKPENIFLVTVGDNSDFVKVLDFGVAKLRDHKTEGGTLTQAGSIFGTPRYMSPEQCSAQPVDARSDLYTLGVILYEMVTGQPPFPGDQALTLLLAHVNEAPPPPSLATSAQVIPAEVEDLVLMLLEKQPAGRVQQAGELARRCGDLADGLPTAFDQRIGTAAEAESLGVRIAQQTTVGFETSRTIQVGGDAVLPKSDAEPARPPPSRALAAAAAAVAIAVAAVVVWLATRPPEVVVQREVIEREVAVPVVGAPDETSVRITVASVPPGAKILHAGKLLGTTNATIDRPKGGPDEVWQLLRDGYEPHAINVGFAADALVSVELKARPPAPVAEPAKAAAQPARSPGRTDGPRADQRADPKPEPKGEARAEPKSDQAKVEAPKADDRKRDDKVKEPAKRDDKIDDDLQ